MKLDKLLGECKTSFKKIDKFVSRFFLHYAAIGGFIFGWFGLAVILHTISGEVPIVFVYFLRIFYFLLSFIVGIKITRFFVDLIRKMI